MGERLDAIQWHVCATDGQGTIRGGAIPNGRGAGFPRSVSSFRVIDGVVGVQLRLFRRGARL